uniref:PPM-type phosphatase domain-containing protein n=1 Tax=Mucochytrium quahogii TaxID=96639 RepID=A0A7S2WR74_9STRA|mmetsp:Transcript_7411/g.16105  ORF Transcript_7411/g.16105 Transcript_7411/m.16105 type:complete len:303 (+) Transcript_7411:394-1302(+)
MFHRILSRYHVVGAVATIGGAAYAANSWKRIAYNKDAENSTQYSKAFSVFASRGPRGTMEDEYYISNARNFFAVFDGHGGAQVAKQAKKEVYECFERELESCDDVEDAYKNAFGTVSASVFKNKKLDMQGTTAVSVYLEEKHIWTANIGDSRAVLCRDGEAVDITQDHKPNSPDEKERIEKLGGNVRWYGYLGPDRQPVPGMGAYRINGNLAVSRALGDRLESPFVSDKPDIECFERDEEADRFIILASDGLWDVMTSREAVRFVQQILAGSVGALEQGAKKQSENAARLSFVDQMDANIFR